MYMVAQSINSLKTVCFRRGTCFNLLTIVDVRRRCCSLYVENSKEFRRFPLDADDNVSESLSTYLFFSSAVCSPKVLMRGSVIVP